MNGPTTQAALFGPSIPDRFPTTRYQGSKRKFIRGLAEVFRGIEFDSALDLFSGTGTVALLLRCLGKTVAANDFQLFNQLCARVLLRSTPSSISEAGKLIDFPQLLKGVSRKVGNVAEHYSGIFFTDEENREIDAFCRNITSLQEYNREVAIYCVGQALLKKRPYNLFHRANLAMRERNVARSFGNLATWNKTIAHHAELALQELVQFRFPSAGSRATVTGHNAANLAPFEQSYDLVYLDPPYLNGAGQSIDYSDFYGFLEGLCDPKLFIEGDAAYPHKPIAKKPSPWSTPAGAVTALSDVVERWPSSVIVLSYRSDGTPTVEEIKSTFLEHQRTADVVHVGDSKYALSRKDDSSEIAVISMPKVTHEVASHRLRERLPKRKQ